MNYFTAHRELAALDTTRVGRSSYRDEIDLATLSFDSDAVDVLAPPAEEQSPDERLLSDAVIAENRRFVYTTVMPHGARTSSSTILLFHGLNEKSWHKYLPWARELVLRTGKSVVLFPIAFHMNRAPDEWSNPRLMMRAAAERQRRYGPIEASSFANAALSSRLHLQPDRFLRSGLETYYDVRKLVVEIRSGRNPLIERGASIDLFGYSIGALLTEVLLLENPDGAFAESRAFLFCGGATLGETTPVSRLIMDSRAGEALREFFLGRLDEELRRDSPLGRLFDRIQTLGQVFRSLLSRESLAELRERSLRSIGRRLGAVALTADRVIPAREVLRTLAPAASGAPAAVEAMDFSYPYTHENPFPLVDSLQEEVEGAFDRVFGLAAARFA